MNATASAGNLWWKVLSLILLAAGFVWWLQRNEPTSVETPPDFDRKVEDLVASEEWIELMGAAMNDRAKGIETIPGREEIEVVSFTNDFIAGDLNLDIGAESDSIFRWQIAKITEVEDGRIGNDKRPWDIFEEEVTELHDGKFGFLRGRFEDEARKIFTARVVFSAKGKLADGNVASFESEQEIRWRLGAGGTIPSRKNDYLMIPDEWQVSDWLVKEAKLTTAGAQPFFVEVTDQAIPDEGDRKLIESTKHAGFLEALFGGEKIPLRSEYGRYFTTDATAQHPALSVVDLNNDGWDDLYVCVRWGRNLFFSKQG